MGSMAGETGTAETSVTAKKEEHRRMGAMNVSHDVVPSQSPVAYSVEVPGSLCCWGPQQPP